MNLPLVNPSHQLMDFFSYKMIDSSILQGIFSSVSMEEKQRWNKIKKEWVALVAPTYFS